MRFKTEVNGGRDFVLASDANDVFWIAKTFADESFGLTVLLSHRHESIDHGYA